MTASNKGDSCQRKGDAMNAGKSTGGLLQDGSMSLAERDEYQKLLLNYSLDQSRNGLMIWLPTVLVPDRERLEFLRSNAGPAKPTMPTNGTT